jgi:aryl-alcohol dehydrogenase-like predicted oxidoreductase
MKYGRIKSLNKPVSRIVFGTAFSDFMSGESDVSELLDCAVSHGVNTFDCAKEYGCAQAVLGNWLKKRRDVDDLVIETKGCHPLASQDYAIARVTKEALDSDIAESLDLLHVRTIDIFMLHRDDPNVEVGEIMEWLNKQLRQGSIATFGASNWSASRIKEANRYARDHGLQEMVITSPNYSLAQVEESPWVGEIAALNSSSSRSAAERSWYQESHMALFAYSVLSRGFLSGAFRSDDLNKAQQVLDPLTQTGFLNRRNLERLRRAEVLAEELGVSVAQVAIAWVLNSRLDAFALLSSNSTHIVKSNVESVDIALTGAQRAWLNLECDRAE